LIQERITPVGGQYAQGDADAEADQQPRSDGEQRPRQVLQDQRGNRHALGQQRITQVATGQIAQERRILLDYRSIQVDRKFPTNDVGGLGVRHPLL
jgi:hypothetical protein